MTAEPTALPSTRLDSLSTRGLVGLTAGKTVVNMGIRWIPFFLPTLGPALGASTSQLTTALGVGETAGLLTAASGGRLDRGHERRVMTEGMALVALSTVLGIVGNFWVFAASQFLLILGVSFYTVGGHAYISRHVQFTERGRSIGIFEMSWALGLLVGAPSAAFLIEGFSWRLPFIVVGILATGTTAALLVATKDDVALADAPSTVKSDRHLDANAWFAVGASAGIALAGLTTLVIIGTWMDEALGVSTGGIGAVAMGLGLMELASSSSSARFSDRLGKNRSSRAALALLTVGLVVMCLAGSSFVIGVVGLLLFFLGFEYAIVTSFSVVSEAMPSARGKVLSVNMATGTVARGVGSIASGFLYEAFGIAGPAALSGFGAISAIVLFALVTTK